MAAGNGKPAVTADVVVVAAEVINKEQADRAMEEGTPFHRVTLP